MKKLLSVAFVCLLLAVLSVAACADVIMYSPDGGSVWVDESDIDMFRSYGWYEGVTVYAPDGRYKTVSPFRVEAEIAVGWYTHPVTTMYALDGRVIVVASSAVDAYMAVGWYPEPVTQMYAPDGSTMCVLASEVEMYAQMGWYYHPVTTVYAPDGRSEVIALSALESYKAVGWFTEPVVIMYAADGRTQYVLLSQVEANKQVGWYISPEAAARGPLLVANQSDLNRLDDFLSPIVYSMKALSYYRYDATTFDAREKAKNMSIGSMYPFIYADMYGSDSIQMMYWQDPKGLFPTEFYYSLPSYRVDYITQNVFGITPDTSTYLNMHYYLDGNYYMYTVPSEWGAYNNDITSISLNDDGTYTIESDIYFSSLEDYNEYYNTTYRWVVGLRNVNGSRMWCVYSISDLSKTYTYEDEPYDITLVNYTASEAVKIAEDYWEVVSSYDVSIFNMGECYSDDGTMYYEIHLKWLVDNSHYSTIDRIFVSSVTGRIYYSI